MQTWAIVVAGALFVGGGGLVVISHVQFLAVLVRAIGAVW